MRNDAMIEVIRRLEALERRLNKTSVTQNSGGSGAPTDAQYYVAASDPDLTNEVVLAEGANIDITAGVVSVSPQGAASGLNADLLDGQHGSFYQDAGNLNAGTVPYARLPNAVVFKVKNASGATANAGGIGYIDGLGEYKTTTTAGVDAAWCVVVVGGSNNSDIFVSRRGRVTVNYTGADPSASEFLVTSTSAGLAARQVTMRPEVFAVCLANGSGGTVEVLLLTQRRFIAATNATALWGFNNVSGNRLSDRDFVATLNGAANNVAKTAVYNAPSSGHENNLDLRTGLLEAAIYNTTRSQTAWLVSTNVGTNTITFSSDSDLSAWANGDTINIRSTVVDTAGAGGYYFGEFRFTASANKPALATHIHLSLSANDNGVTQGKTAIAHACETFGAGKQKFSRSQVSALTNTVGPYAVAITDGYVDFAWQANATSGAHTCFLDGWTVAEP